MKVTKTQFNLFCNEFKRYVDKFGLLEWELRFFLEDIGVTLSLIVPEHLGRICKVSFTENWVDLLPLTDAVIKETAKHEALELLIADAYTMAVCRFVTESEIETVMHSLVRRLEKLID